MAWSKHEHRRDDLRHAFLRHGRWGTFPRRSLIRRVADQFLASTESLRQISVRRPKK